MKSKLHVNQLRPLSFFFIVLCCFIILFASHFLLLPSQETASLDVLLLDPNTTPVFCIDSQLSYEHEAVDTWVSTLTPLTHTLEQGHASDRDLHLLLRLQENKLDTSFLTQDLLTLSNYFSTISLSVLPSEQMSDEAYLSQYQALYQLLSGESFSSISLIAYPPTTANLSLYTKDYISSIGTVLQTRSDLEVLHQLYTYFSNEKILVVRDEIKDFYATDPKIAAQEITATYYLLAIKYPDIHMIFSPCILPSFEHEDGYILNSSEPSFELFNIIYTRLLNQPWITTSSEALSNTSPYKPLQDYDLLTGQVEIILAPDAAILKAVEASPSEHSRLYFKWNETPLTLNASYPYVITLDTKEQPNGISRLSFILQADMEAPYQRYFIDLTINNPSTDQRAKRFPTQVTPNATYVKPSTTYIPILMYHTIEENVLPEDQNSHVETAVFESQMKALLENGYTPINFYDLKCYIEGLVTLPQRPVIITMDDGYLNNYTNAYPIYKKYNIQATLFVSPYYMMEENTDRHFGWLAAKEMEASGLIDIQPHGYDHTPLPYLSSKDMIYHVSLAKGLIESHLGPRDVSVLAYPQFRHNRHTINTLNTLNMDFQITNLAKRGTVLSSLSSPKLSPPTLQRINVPNTMSPDTLIATLNELTH